MTSPMDLKTAIFQVNLFRKSLSEQLAQDKFRLEWTEKMLSVCDAKLAELMKKQPGEPVHENPLEQILAECPLKKELAQMMDDPDTKRNTP